MEIRYADQNLLALESQERLLPTRPLGVLLVQLPVVPP